MFSYMAIHTSSAAFFCTVNFTMHLLFLYLLVSQIIEYFSILEEIKYEQRVNKRKSLLNKKRENSSVGDHEHYTAMDDYVEEGPNNEEEMKQVADNLLNKQHFDRVLSGNFSHLEVETLEENIIMEEMGGEDSKTTEKRESEYTVLYSEDD